MSVLESLGYKPAAETHKTRRRILMSSQGWHKSGKTHFALTAPKPLVVYNFDTGLDELLDKPPFNTQLGEIIPVEDFRFDLEIEPGIEFKLKESVWIECKNKWISFKEHLRKVALSGEVRSVVIDSGSQLYVLGSIARWGKYGQVPAQAYGAFYIEFEEALKVFYDSDCNLIVTHKMKDKFDQPGDELRGYKDMQFLTQVHLHHEKDRATGQLSTTIVECRQNKAAERKKFELLEIEGMDPFGMDFTEVAKAVFPNSTDEDWA